MKRTTALWKKIMAVSLLGAFTIVPVVDGITSAQAAPPHRQDRDHGRRDHDKGRDRDHHRDRDHRDRDHRDRDRRDRHDRRDDNKRPGWGWGDRNHDHDKRDRHDRRDRDNDRRRQPYPGWGNEYRSYTGVVTNTRSGDKFDVRIDGKTYNVYLSGRRPRGLDRNDVVRVYGKRVGSNDIRNASVRILRNR